MTVCVIYMQLSKDEVQGGVPAERLAVHALSLLGPRGARRACLGRRHALHHQPGDCQAHNILDTPVLDQQNDVFGLEDDADARIREAYRIASVETKRGTIGDCVWARDGAAMASLHLSTEVSCCM